LVRDDGEEFATDDDNAAAACIEETEEVDKYGVNLDGLSRSGRIGKGVDGEVVVWRELLNELALSLSMELLGLVLALVLAVLAPDRPARPR